MAYVSIVKPRSDSGRHHLDSSCFSQDQPPPVDLHHHALCLFFQDYVLQPSADTPGWLSYLPPAFQKAAHNSPLQQAVFAASYANLGQKLADQQLIATAVAYYIKALQSVNLALSNHEVRSSGDTITAIVLLGHYEVRQVRCLLRIGLLTFSST